MPALGFSRTVLELACGLVVLFLEQTAVGAEVWARPFVPLRWPRVINLRMDPLERAKDESMNYTLWSIQRVFALVPAQAFVAQWISSFKEFPPRQKVMEKLTSAPAVGRKAPSISSKRLCGTSVECVNFQIIGQPPRSVRSFSGGCRGG